MPEIAAQLHSLVDEPREALNIEIKRWLDLSDKSDQCTVAKAAIALANHGGGFLVLGFEELSDGSFRSHEPRPSSLDSFSQDVVARIVATYAEPAFQVAVTHVARQADGATFPVIQVPGGHRTPIMAKKGSPDQKTLIAGRTYIRRPTPESAEPASAVEWRDLLDRCVRAGRDELLDAIRGVLDGRGTLPPTEPSEMDRLASWVSAGVVRWRALAPAPQGSEPVDPPGTYLVAYQIEGDLPPHTLGDVLLKLRDVPGYTGWRPWWVPSREGIRPYQYDGAIECYHGLDGKRTADPAHADFWRVNNHGQALLIRGYDEDSYADQVSQGTVFDLTLPIWRIGECLMHAAGFTERLLQEPRRITFMVKWTGLAGRELASLDRRREIYPGHASKQDELTVSVTADSDRIADQLPELLYELLLPLYSLFDFFELRKTLVDDEVQRMRSGR